MSELNNREQAMLIWPVLALAARMQRVLTYGEIEGLTGIARVGQAKPLWMINDYCKRKRYPLLNTIAVSGHGEKVGFPSEGEPDGFTSAEFLEERAKVFAFDWTNKDKPRPSDFEVPQSTST